MKSSVRPTSLIALTSAAILLTLAGCSNMAHKDDGHHTTIAGNPGNPAEVSRTVQIDMGDDMRFAPASLDVKQGETIRFEVKNSGKIVHEFVIGTTEEILAHNQAMMKMPGMEHEESNMVTLKADERGDVVWHFTNAGTVDIACLQPGHYEAGMKGTISVNANPE